ncbi:hypothetical protein P3X46_003870 [Hevea brasiliensis]|uniref:Uncharacterized protein n=1 Tax=Hevea brasiliensis TaxID=3981 RepID=A0ABQ9N9S0_HEVBR|nr:putative UPF0481 protein At3g02645 [Hevea brasiliensis]XP_021670807.2 putative UPF0481 protein At3g02645 [Hevea brasiliensis]KAJ9188518.1 hypothetical protein P3X46_003870 [Hevea brasiliensis]
MGEDNSASTSKGTQKPLNQLIIDIPENLETTFSNSVCIYRVPPTLRKIHEEAYTPQVISIGPIHHHKTELKAMEIQKLRYLKEFCKRQESKTESEFLSDLINIISEEDIRGYYDDISQTCNTELVNMILLDSVFILELFLRNHEEKEHTKDHAKDFIIGKPWLRTDVQQDLVLLENQLPFAFLEKIYDFAKKNIYEIEYPPFLDLTCTYFSNYKPRKIEKIPNPVNRKPLHFTDLVRYFWSFEHPPIMHAKSIESLCSITKLHRAGLKLKPARNECFLNIKFVRGIPCLWRAELQLPCFDIDDTTEYVVRNLMALEQCHYPYETYICSYIRLWDFLIDTAEDVDLLVGKKIIVNGLGDSAAVADLVNKLCNQIAEVQSCYYFMSEQLNGYYENFCNHTMAALRSVYFGDLWIGTGTVAAVVLLVLTLIQTICSVLAL